MKDVDFWTDEIKKLSDFLEPVVGDFREFNFGESRVFAWTIYKDKDLHCAKSYMEKGAEFPLHEHKDSVESLILLSGEADLICVNKNGESKSIPFIKRIPLHLGQGEIHKISVKEDSLFFAIFIPPSSEFE